eukprot:14256004-Alexandrium_andersonii.AAC.1
MGAHPSLHVKGAEPEDNCEVPPNVALASDKAGGGGASPPRGASGPPPRHPTAHPPPRTEPPGTTGLAIL